MDSSIHEQEPASSWGHGGGPSPSAPHRPPPQQGRGTLEVGGNTRLPLAGLGTQTRHSWFLRAHRWPAGVAPSQAPPAELG